MVSQLLPVPGSPLLPVLRHAQGIPGDRWLGGHRAPGHGHGAPHPFGLQVLAAALPTHRGWLCCCHLHPACSGTGGLHPAALSLKTPLVRTRSCLKRGARTDLEPAQALPRAAGHAAPTQQRIQWGPMGADEGLGSENWTHTGAQACVLPEYGVLLLSGAERPRSRDVAGVLHRPRQPSTSSLHFFCGTEGLSCV